MVPGISCPLVPSTYCLASGVNSATSSTASTGATAPVSAAASTADDGAAISSTACSFWYLSVKGQQHKRGQVHAKVEGKRVTTNGGTSNMTLHLGWRMEAAAHAQLH